MHSNAVAYSLREGQTQSALDARERGGGEGGGGDEREKVNYQEARCRDHWYRCGGCGECVDCLLTVDCVERGAVCARVTVASCALTTSSTCALLLFFGGSSVAGGWLVFNLLPPQASKLSLLLTDPSSSHNNYIATPRHATLHHNAAHWTETCFIWTGKVLGFAPEKEHLLFPEITARNHSNFNVLAVAACAMWQQRTHGYPQKN